MSNKILDDEINYLLSNSINKLSANSLVKDLTYLKTYTIDDENTKEIDDAISLERLSSNFKLWIHIASPTSYIDFQSSIDIKARKQISTLYLSTNNFYMLPEALINNVFSLHENEKRGSISLGVILNEDGSVSFSEIVQSIIKVNYRLSYIEADELIDYAPKEEEDLSIISMILKKRKCWRNNLGAIEIQESHGKIIVKDNIPSLKIVDPTLSRQLVSEAMILYGNLISEFTKKNNIPVPYRVQESFVKCYKKEYTDNKENILYNFLLKKTMGKTYYSLNPMVHNSLGLSSYLHATSPIRRYADLLVQYQLNRFLNNKDLILKGDVENLILSINNLGRQNNMKYREDQKFLLKKWFEKNPIIEHNVILLEWINRYKNICIFYFVEYKLSSICYFKSKYDLNIGDNFKVKFYSNNCNDILYFNFLS